MITLREKSGMVGKLLTRSYTLQVEEMNIEVRHKPMKNIRLRVCVPDGEVKVSAPKHVRTEMLEKFIHTKLEWIREHQQRVRNHPPTLWQPIVGPLKLQYHQQLMEQLPPLIARYEKALQVSVKSFGLRHMKTRWGTCHTRRHHVCFNLELARRAPEALEYVVAHELAHLRVPGHGKRFHALMDEVMPDWRARKLTLR